MISIEKTYKLDWKKTKGLIPSIIQHYVSGEILMHGYMNKLALKKTISNEKVTFFSRTKKKLWTKGKTSGNYLIVKQIYSDCDNDALLILVKPKGKTCHLNNYSCFSKKIHIFSFLFYLEKIIKKRKEKKEKTYTLQLLQKGIYRIAQKVGEEAIETVLASIKNEGKELIEETSDLIFHLLILLNYKNLTFYQIIKNLKQRNSKKK